MRHGRLHRMWWIWLLVGTAATGGYFLVPTGTLAATAVYSGIGLASAVAMGVGIRLHQPVRRLPWYLFVTGTLLFVCGDIVYEVYRTVLHLSPYPSAADAFYLAAYPPLIAGLLVILRARAGRDAAGAVDGAVIATGVGLVFWVFIMRPVTQEVGVPAPERFIGLAYPAADVLLLAILARLFTTARTRTASHRLLTLAALLLLVSDGAFSLINLYSDYTGGLTDAGFLLSYVCWSAAALHPSMWALTQRSGIQPSARLRRRRLAVLAVSSLLAPGVLFVQGLTSPDDIDWLAIGASAVLLCLLVMLRISGLLHQMRRQAHQLEALAMHDELTGLANRRLFEQRLRVGLSGRPQVALVDLDEFKDVNDRLGHAVGDQLLAVVGSRLAAVLRHGDLVARMGGDEFAILLPDTTPSAADGILDTVAEVLRQPVMAGGHTLLVQASIGAADGAGITDPFEALRRADVAMYAAKKIGDGTRWYEPQLDEHATELAHLGAQLRVALDTDQFQLVYQPIVALPHGAVVAVEALVRWHHPTRGMVSPADFIPVAERNGLIVGLGAWILRTACAQAAGWRTTLGDAAPERINVNVSARQLTEPGFARLVASTLAETGLPARCLTIEVTETAVFGGTRAVEVLDDIHRLGVRIALDDFGTGHSSLGLLQTVPVDILKVDKSFVDGVTMAGRHAVIATALITLSEGLHLTAVAEGVETAEQARELYHLGYRFAQGYHFGRPVADPVFAARPAAAQSAVA